MNTVSGSIFGIADPFSSDLDSFSFAIPFGAVLTDITYQAETTVTGITAAQTGYSLNGFVAPAFDLLPSPITVTTLLDALSREPWVYM